MAVSLKRNISFDKDVSCDHEITSLKKPKLSSFGCNLLLSRQDADNSSSDDESADEGELRSTVLKKKTVDNNKKKLRRQRRDQRNIKKTLGTTPMDFKLSKAVAQYSDDEESEGESFVKSTQQMNRSFSTSSTYLSAIPTSPQFDVTGPVKSKSHPPESDFAARARCFDYLIGAIDEAWARYCDATAYAEDEAYGYDTGAPHTPASIATSDDEDGYRSEISATTNITDYETDFDDSKTRSHSAFTLNDSFGSNYKNNKNYMVNYNNNNNNNNNTSNGNRVSEAPANVRLQELKDRLIKAKYFLQDYVDSSDPKQSLMFWKRWDLIKYATIELVEDDDEDEVIESTIEDLENGRFQGAFGA